MSGAGCRSRRGPIALALLISALAGLAAAAQSTPGRVFAWVESLKATAESPIRWPVSVATSPSGEVGIADVFGSRLLLYQRVGVSWDLRRTVELPAAPAGLAHDGERFVVALRGGGLVAIERDSSAPRRLLLPEGVVAGPVGSTAEGQLLVADVTAHRVLLLSSGGELLRQIPVDRHVTALAAGNQGGFFAAVVDPPALLRYDQDGVLMTTWEIPGVAPRSAWPAGIAVEPGGDVIVSDRIGGRIIALDASGRWIGQGSRRGWEPGLLRYPGALARLPDGGLLVTDQGNSRVQVFRRTDRGAGG